MSMQNVAPALQYTAPKRNELTHIPGDEGWPIIGKTFQVLADPKGHIEANGAKYGPVYRTHIFGETNVATRPRFDSVDFLFRLFDEVLL